MGLMLHRTSRSRTAFLTAMLVVAGVLTVFGAVAGCKGKNTGQARAEAALTLLTAMNSGDADAMIAGTTGKLAEQSEEAKDELGEPTPVTVAGKQWDGAKLTAKLTSKDEDGKDQTVEVVITPSTTSDDVEVREAGAGVEGTEGEFFVIKFVWDGAWKAEDYLIGGTQSWVEAVEASKAEQKTLGTEWMSEEDTRPASVCKRNQAAIEGAFMGRIEGGNAGIDVSSYQGGSVKGLASGPAAIVPDPLKAMPHCSTEKTDYTYEIKTMEGKGTFITVSCSNPEHRR